MLILLFLLAIFFARSKSASTNLKHAIRPKVSVVGAGVGGLVAGARLALSGMDVTIFEKNPSSCNGGRMRSEYIGPYRYPLFAWYVHHLKLFRFDVGPSLLLLPDVYYKTFSLLGRNMDDLVTIKRVLPFYRCFFEEDGSYLDIDPDKANMRTSLEAVEKNAWTSYQKYIEVASAFLGFGFPNIVEETFNLTTLLPFISASIKSFPLLSHHDMLSSYFKSPKLIAALSFQDLYVGLAPYEAPAVFSLLQALEFNQGIYYPVGGFQTIAEALTIVAEEAGVIIKNNHTVERIESTDDANSEIKVETTISSGDVVWKESSSMALINMDAPAAELELIEENARDDRTATSRPSCGVVSISIAFNTTLSPLQHHSIFFSKHYRSSWDAISYPDDAIFNSTAFNFYVHAPSRTDPSCCPNDHDAITVLVPVPPLRSKDNSIAYNVDEIKMAVLRRMQSVVGMPSNLEKYIVAIKVRSPTIWHSELGLFRGSAFGLSHSLSQLSALRPRFKHPRLRKVYRVGASTRPGNGVPLVMVGARLVTDVMLEDQGQNQD